MSKNFFIENNRLLSFTNKTKHGTVIVPDGVTEISTEAFKLCSMLEEVIIPDSVKSLGDRCFRDCTNLRKINIPKSVNFIGTACFKNTSLEEISIPEGITEISSRCFQYCQNLKTVNLPNSVNIIGIAAFQGCTSLAEIILPENLKEIGPNAFAVTNLKNVIVPDSVEEIGSYAFMRHDFNVASGEETKINVFMSPYLQEKETVQTLIDREIQELEGVDVQYLHLAPLDFLLKNNKSLKEANEILSQNNNLER